MKHDASQTVILAAVDLAEDSPGVLSRALELAATHRDAVLHVLSVMPLGDVALAAAAGGQVGDPLRGALERLRGFVESQIDDHALRHPDVASPVPGRPPKMQIHCAMGNPASEIVWFAAHFDADVVVVATHARKGLRRLLLGSVAERVSRLAGCAVLVVRDKHHAAPWKIPEIEPVCADCAATRLVSCGGDLWCARHSIHHQRAHVVSRSSYPPGPSPTESATGI